MKFLSLKDRKGLSEIIGYVLLIVISIGVAGMVWAFLNFYLPEERPQCPEDLMIGVSEIECSNGQITMTLENRGLFSIDGAYVKIGDVDRVAKDDLCFEGSAGGNCNIYFFQETTVDGRRILDKGLQSGENLRKTFFYSETGEMEIEIEPVVFVDDTTTAVCRNAIISSRVNCIE